MNEDPWDKLRAQLLPCPRCKASRERLVFACAQLCATARVYCQKCGYGINEPLDHIVYAALGHDARPRAVETWNAISRAP